MCHVQPESEVPYFVGDKIKISWCEEDNKVVELHLKLNGDTRSGDDEFIKSAPLVGDQKELLVKKEFNSCLKESSDHKWETRTFEKIKVESIDGIIDEKFDCDVTVPLVKSETNDVNAVTAKELLNYCHESPFKSEALEQEELHIKQEEDNENIGKEFDNDTMFVRESGAIKKETNTNTENAAAAAVELTRKPGNRLVLHQCPKCPYTARKKYHLKRHSIKHKKSDEIDWYSCQECPYKTCRKDKLKSHAEIHNKKHAAIIHQCPECPYKTCRKNDLKRHAEIHNKLILKCSKRSYETLRPISLKKHHTERKTIVKRLHCSECSFKTHQPCLLQRHILGHKGDAFKCASCAYQTGRKDLLVIHQVKHESMDKWHSCPLCPFKTYAKKIIQAHCRRRHSVDPNNPKQIVVFKCTECPYENGYKRNVKTHQLIHNQSGWFQCPDCAYKTPHRSNFKKHRLRHQGENAEGWHRCLECPYKTASNYDLQKHVIKHKSADEIRWLECSQCSFKTAHKDSLTRHELRHKDAQEVEWFCCYECTFKTIHKLSLFNHLSKHKK